jgi:hypothetical protein
MTHPPGKIRPTHRQVARHDTDGDIREAETVADHKLPRSDNAAESGQATIHLALLAFHPRPASALKRAMAFEEQKHECIADAVAEDLDLSSGEFSVNIVGQQRRGGIFRLEVFQDEA